MIHILDRSVPIRAAGLRVAELLLVFATLFVAWMSGSEARLNWTAATYVQVCIVATVVLFCMYCLDLYDPQVAAHQLHSFSRIVQAIGLTMLAIPLLTWLWMPIDVLRMVSAMFLLGAALTGSRYLFSELAARAAFTEPAVVWGSGPLAASIISEIRKRRDLRLRVMGIVENGDAARSFANVRYLGTPDAIWNLSRLGNARKIIVAIAERRGCLPAERLMSLKTAGITFDDGAELYEQLTGKVWLRAFSTSSLLFSRKFHKSRLTLFVNRCLSGLCAVIALIVAAPVMLVVAVLIRLDSGGPVILRQTRIGENGRYFTLFKFRSMKVGSDRESILAPATHDDPRCTRVGKWIRRFRLDELPQLFNIIKGDMYFIGPRPFVPDQEAELVQHIPNYCQRWTVRPGITGWAQVHRGYCASIEDNEDKLSYDLFYIKNRSMTLDAVTLLKTLKIILLGRGGR